MGYDYASFRTIPLGLPGEPNYRLADNPVLLKELKAALRQTGIKGLDVELARIIDDVDVRTYLPDLEAAAELGIRQVVSSVWTTNRAYAIDSLGRLCDLGAKIGMTINLEFVTWAAVRTLRDAVEMIQAVNKPNCGLLVDTLHFSRSQVSLEDLRTIPDSWFNIVHLCDAPPEIPSTKEELIYTAREARLDPGQGGIDLAAILNRIPDVPYSLELPNFERVKRLGYTEHVRLALLNAKNYFATHPRQKAL
ncbi:MAG: sugar phosphate isomerase/epimerase family protein [Candidatus Acidiferrales bacterium]